MSTSTDHLLLRDASLICAVSAAAHASFQGVGFFFFFFSFFPLLSFSGNHTGSWRVLRTSAPFLNAMHIRSRIMTALFPIEPPKYDSVHGEPLSTGFPTTQTKLRESFSKEQSRREALKITAERNRAENRYRKNFFFFFSPFPHEDSSKSTPLLSHPHPPSRVEGPLVLLYGSEPRRQDLCLVPRGTLPIPPRVLTAGRNVAMQGHSMNDNGKNEKANN
jgi:hypothetical protein